MPEDLGLTAATAASPNHKLAMSRALGAAFLNHQVQQLEKSVSNGPASGNWRDRRRAQADSDSPNPGGGANQGPKRPPHKGTARTAKKKVAGSNEVVERLGKPRNSEEATRLEKDADIIIADASVLVHALHQVKAWCKDDRKEVVIVPLEALNTLDLLKKGTTPLAQRARAASRTLEAQVGTNSRIRVQQDDAFVLWDSIIFQDTSDANNEKDKSSVMGHHQTGGPPEWVRRTICCAQWEIEHARNHEGGLNEPAKHKHRVVLAVLSHSPHLDNQLQTNADIDSSVDQSVVVKSPVPLPAPSPHVNKFEGRSTGTLVSHWGARAGISLMEVKPLPPNTTPLSRHQAHGKGSSDEDRPKRIIVGHGQGARGRLNSPSAIGSSGGNATRSGLVERPPAVMAMMEMVAQPSKVVRVLARGEKLDPDP